MVKQGHGPETPDPIPIATGLQGRVAPILSKSARVGQVLAITSFTLERPGGRMFRLQQHLLLPAIRTSSFRPHQAVVIPDSMLTRGATYFVAQAARTMASPGLKSSSFSVAAAAPQLTRSDNPGPHRGPLYSASHPMLLHRLQPFGALCVAAASGPPAVAVVAAPRPRPPPAPAPTPRPRRPQPRHLPPRW